MRARVSSVGAERPMREIMPEGYESTDTYRHGLFREIVVDIEEVYRGSSTPGPTLLVRDISRVCCAVVGAPDRPTWTPGEHVILFLRHDQFQWFPGWSIYEVWLGKWIIDEERNTAAMSVGVAAIPLADLERQVRGQR